MRDSILFQTVFMTTITSLILLIKLVVVKYLRKKLCCAEEFNLLCLVLSIQDLKILSTVFIYFRKSYLKDLQSISRNKSF